MADDDELHEASKRLERFRSGKRNAAPNDGNGFRPCRTGRLPVRSRTTVPPGTGNGSRCTRTDATRPRSVTCRSLLQSGMGVDSTDSESVDRSPARPFVGTPGQRRGRVWGQRTARHPSRSGNSTSRSESVEARDCAGARRRCRPASRRRPRARRRMTSPRSSGRACRGRARGTPSAAAPARPRARAGRPPRWRSRSRRAPRRDARRGGSGWTSSLHPPPRRRPSQRESAHARAPGRMGR